MDYLLVFISGVVLGAIIVLIINWIRSSQTKDIAKQLVETVESQRVEDMENILGRVKDSFRALSLDALSQSSEQFLKLAYETLSRQTQTGEKDLEGKKKLIDETLNLIKTDLEKLQGVVTDLEKDREKKFGEVVVQIKNTAEQTEKLQATANDLKTALSGTKARGQWGERMAEDVMNLLGFQEGLNYLKQKSADGLGSIPDFAFLLPNDQKVNMDVKFPLNNYLKYLEAEGNSDKENHRKQFLKDVKNRIKEVTGRNYISPDQGTVDYVIVFIPNEQVFSFINEQDSSIIDEALKNKVILCSPITLFAVLAVIRQAVVNFRLERATNEMILLFGQFDKQWTAFVASFDKLGKRIDETQSEFLSLRSTRVNQLEKPLNRIEKLREGLPTDMQSIQETK
ncbi:MAG: DNA recombination protein RmuC [Deltaproteobacteria bacterium]|nr:DNA recombination protein RmuC [Deltaproteobacteria bacterium]